MFPYQELGAPDSLILVCQGLDPQLLVRSLDQDQAAVLIVSSQVRQTLACLLTELLLSSQATTTQRRAHIALATMEQAVIAALP